MAVICALVATGVLLKTNSSKAPFIIAAGVLASLIASTITLWLTVLVIGDSTGRVEAAARQLDSGLIELKSATAVLTQAHEHGVHAVKPKGAYSDDEWHALLDGAKERLFIVGHALDKWCKDGMRQHFLETVQRLARDGREVWLVTLPLDDGRRHDVQRGVLYDNRIRTTIKAVVEMRSGLPLSRRDHVQLRALKPDVVMPYTVAGNERILIVAPYPGTEQVSGTMLALTLSSDGLAGRVIRDDVAGLFRRCTDPIELNETG